MRAATVLIVLAFLVAPALAPAPALADDGVVGSWLGLSDELGYVYRLVLDEDGGGSLEYVSHASIEPEHREYAVRWERDGERLRFELTAVGDLPDLWLKGKRLRKSLELELKRRRGARPETLFVFPEDGVLDDYRALTGSTP